MFFTRHFFLKALAGLSKQGPVFRNSYVTGHLWAPSRRVLTLRLRGSWGTEVRGWSPLALAARADIFFLY
jgi:hypothetical protein